jgi:hypothetical protein
LHVEDHGEDLELGVGWRRLTLLLEIGDRLSVVDALMDPDENLVVVPDSPSGLVL